MGLRRSKGGERGAVPRGDVRDCVVCGLPLVLRERKYHVRCNPKYQPRPCLHCGAPLEKGQRKFHERCHPIARALRQVDAALDGGPLAAINRTR